MEKIWIIAADKKELPQIDLILDAGFSDKFQAEFHTCGIGLFESFFVFSSLLDSVLNTFDQPDSVLLVGTAGSPDANDIYKTALTNNFLNPQFTFEQLPEFLPQTWNTVAIDGLHDQREFSSVPVYSTFGISTSSEQLSKSMSGAWENMEALSLSYVCMKHKIPFMALLCCTNQVCPDGRKQWLANYKKAGEILFEKLCELFQSK